MKRTVILALCLLFGALPALAKPGCLSKTQKLKQKFDTKAWHYVSCSCPCDSYRPKGLYVQKMNQCVECGHRHEPRPLIYMNQLAQARASKSQFPPSAHAALQRAITRWRHGK